MCFSAIVPSAFTLVELLLAIAVLGIIAGFVLYKFHQMREKVYIDAMKNDLRVFSVAREQHFARTGSYGDTARIRAAGHRFTAGVYPDSRQVSNIRWYLRVARQGTRTRCELDVSSMSSVASENKIRCTRGDGDSADASGAPVADFVISPDTTSVAARHATFSMSSLSDAGVNADASAPSDEYRFGTGVSLLFDGSASHARDGDSPTYFWTFGDGTTGAVNRPHVSTPWG